MSPTPARKQRARELRRRITPAEKILWQQLRNRAFSGFKFRRQHPIGPYFADFTCHECRVIIEADGESHLGRHQEDEERSEYLAKRGWLVLRFWNNEIFDEPDAVMESIYRACVERHRPPHPHPLSPEAVERGE